MSKANDFISSVGEGLKKYPRFKKNDVLLFEKDFVDSVVFSGKKYQPWLQLMKQFNFSGKGVILRGVSKVEAVDPDEMEALAQKDKELSGDDVLPPTK